MGELTPKTRPQFGLQAATRLHEAGIASNRRSAIRTGDNWSERMISHTGTETRPDSYRRQQWGIFCNGRKPDGAMLRE
ncbi:Hypothetical predicted protein, partial [Olea europaea subsp. europaea]